ncbi:hypothetical protein [Streptomyces sp. NPDC006477]|uniref:hypothetical protein n=1 Tax=Streptomyces sp. NPDC006477 TaxID=3364747 RepID=UPI003692B8D7
MSPVTGRVDSTDSKSRFGAWHNRSRRREPRRPSAHRLTIMWKAPEVSVIMEA